MVSDQFSISFKDVKYTREICAQLTSVQAESLLNLVKPNEIRRKRLRAFSEECRLMYHRNVKPISCHRSASITSRLVIPTGRNPEQFQFVKKIAHI